jgi:serine protease Do
MKLHRHFFVFSTLLAVAVGLRAEAVKDREGAVRKDRATWENDDRWIYNDLDRGFAEAKLSGKPLLVVLRCIPCLACAGLDARVLMEEQELQPLLESLSA